MHERDRERSFIDNQDVTAAGRRKLTIEPVYQEKKSKKEKKAKKHKDKS
jgi:hypothetical protein